MSRIEELVRKGAGRMQGVNILAVIAGIILGPGFIAVGVILRFFLDNTVPSDILIFFGVLFTVLLIAMCVEVWNKKQAFTNLISFLSKGEPKLAWVFLESRSSRASEAKTSSHAGKFFHLHLLFVNKSRARLWLNGIEAYELYTLLIKKYQSLSTGWNRELYKTWKKSPHTLIEAPQRTNAIMVTVTGSRSAD